MDLLLLRADAELESLPGLVHMALAPRRVDPGQLEADGDDLVVVGRGLSRPQYAAEDVLEESLGLRGVAALQGHVGQHAVDVGDALLVRRVLGELQSEVKQRLGLVVVALLRKVRLVDCGSILKGQQTRMLISEL